jgi:phospholipase D1/2
LVEEFVPETAVFDPERPVDVEQMLASFVPDVVSEEHRPLFWRIGSSLLVLAGLAVVWRWTPISGWLAPERLVPLTDWLQQHPAGPFAAAAAFAIGSCVMVPVVAMIVTAGLVFGWLTGFAVALAGAVAGTAAGYAIGRLLWRDAIRRLGGRRLNRLSRALAKRGVTAVALVRLVPVAPFTVVNLVAGASQISLRDCLLGTLLGMAPGTLAITVFASSAKRAIREPGWSTVLSVVVLAGLLWWGFRRLRRHLEGRESPGNRGGEPRRS